MNLLITLVNENKLFLSEELKCMNPIVLFIPYSVILFENKTGKIRHCVLRAYSNKLA